MKKIVLNISQICMALISIIVVYSILKLFVKNDFDIGLWCGIISTNLIWLTNPYFKTPNQNG